MSASFWVISAVIMGICVFIFKKTVSNDAENDYRLRDILTHAEEDLSQRQPKPQPKPESVPAEVYGEKNIYEEMVEKQQQEASFKNAYSEDYSTTAHENQTTETKQEEPVFYEKINDDACEPDSYNDTDDDYTEEEQDISEKVHYSKTDYSDEYDYEQPLKTFKKKMTLLGFIKTFWRGITFTIGLLVCLYSFIGIISQVQTSNDAIIFSIWLLIGVILIK